MNIEAIKPRITEFAEKYGLTLVVLFGSQVTGQTHKESDVDVAYMSERKLSFNDEALLNTDLTTIFRNDKVSLVNMKTASPLLLKQIVINVMVLYEKSSSIFNEMYLYALKKYDDAKPLFELREDFLNYKISKYHA